MRNVVVLSIALFAAALVAGRVNGRRIPARNG